MYKINILFLIQLANYYRIEKYITANIYFINLFMMLKKKHFKSCFYKNYESLRIYMFSVED